MELTYLGHAGFRIDELLIDAWVAQFSVDEPADVLVITHDHVDHHEGAFDYANEHAIVGTPETIQAADHQEAMNISLVHKTNLL